MQGFDPWSPGLFELYRYLEQNGVFGLVPEHAPGPSIQVLPGCRVRHPLGTQKSFVRYTCNTPRAATTLQHTTCCNYSATHSRPANLQHTKCCNTRNTATLSRLRRAQHDHRAAKDWNLYLQHLYLQHTKCCNKRHAATRKTSCNKLETQARATRPSCCQILEPPSLPSAPNCCTWSSVILQPSAPALSAACLCVCVVCVCVCVRVYECKRERASH